MFAVELRLWANRLLANRFVKEDHQVDYATSYLRGNSGILTSGWGIPPGWHPENFLISSTWVFFLFMKTTKNDLLFQVG